MNSKRRFINVSYTMSYEEHSEGFTMPEFHFHNDYEIYILENGTRMVSIGDEEFVTEAGDVVLFASTMPHKSRGTGDFQGYVFIFQRYTLRGILLRLLLTDLSVYLKLSLFILVQRSLWI